jgi:homoaconitase/3-isopropylmalate dehydratase large subunit
MASVWALGTVLGLEVPGTIKVEISGACAPNVSAKDIILHLIGRLTAQGATFKVIEFHGDAVRRMPTSGRLVLCNMSVEAGATSGIVPPDEETAAYLRGTAGITEAWTGCLPDADAAYDQIVEIDASTLAPQIARPHAVDNVVPVDSVKGIAVDQIVIGSCTNGRLDDIAAAARILKGRKVAAGVRLLVFPASWRIYRESLEAGHISTLMDAGAVIMNPGCGCCLGVHQGALADGDVSLSTTNRNFRGRMGNPKSDVYLCSPEVAAASAITGVITDPR